jgi:hypothetical protein
LNPANVVVPEARATVKAVSVATAIRVASFFNVVHLLLQIVAEKAGSGSA